MAKQRKSRTESFLNLKSSDPPQSLPSPEEVNKVIAKVTGKTIEEQPVSPVVPVTSNRRVPLTTAITPENRAKLEVAAIHSDASIADILNTALEYYFENLRPVNDEELVNTFIAIYNRKKKR